MAERDQSLSSGDSWGAEADEYQKSVVLFSVPAAQRLVQAVDERLALSPSTSRVLDVGAGTGASTRVIAQRAPGVTITATDIAAGMLAKIDQAGLPNTTTIAADALDLSAQLEAANLAGPYSHVFSTFMLQFVPDADRVLRHVFQNMQSGGVIGLNMWHTNPVYDLFLIASLQAASTNPAWSAPDNRYAEGAWQCDRDQDAALRKAGFVDVETRAFDIEADMTSGRDGEAGIETVNELMWGLQNPIKIKAMHGWSGDMERAKAHGRQVLIDEFGSGKRCRMGIAMSIGRKP